MMNRGDTALPVMKRYIAAAQAGDWQSGFRFYAEDIVLHVPGRSPMAGTHRGRGAVVRYLETAIAAAHEVEVEVVDMLASDERVVLIVRERFTRDEELVEIRRANMYRIRDGEIAEIRIFEANQYEADALLSGVCGR